MSFTPGQYYPLAFLTFDTSEYPSDCGSRAAASTLQVFRRVDPLFSTDQDVLSGELLPHHGPVLSAMIGSADIDVDLSRLEASVAEYSRQGEWPSIHYLIGIPFVVREGVEIIHRQMLTEESSGYRGLFVIEFVAGTSEILDLARVLGLPMRAFSGLL